MSKQYKTRLLMSEFVTHDVKRFILSRPKDFTCKAGQAVELSIDSPAWRDEARPFTPTSSSHDEVIEFIIKSYPAHQGVTRELHNLPNGAALQITEPFGSISYQGPGVFLAGGAGITPFIAILRECAQKSELAKNRLIFSNKTPADIICEKELRHYLEQDCTLTCTSDQVSGYEHGRIDKAMLKKHVENFEQNFYVCGPPPFIDAVNEALESLGASAQNLVFDK